MGISTRAYGGIGVLLWMDDVAWPTTAKESCEHPEREGNVFCPVCGVKVETHEVEKLDYHTLVEAFQKTNPDKTHFIAEIVYHDDGRGSNNHGVFIGYGAEAGGYGETVFKTLPVPVAGVMAEIEAWEKAAFEWLKAEGFELPNSIFEAGDYGLHIIDYVSY